MEQAKRACPCGLTSSIAGGGSVFRYCSCRLMTDARKSSLIKLAWEEETHTPTE